MFKSNIQKHKEKIHIKPKKGSNVIMVFLSPV